MDPEEETAQATASTLRPAPEELDTALGPSAGPKDTASSGLPRGTSLGRFIVIDTLGAGAMGEVVLAYDPDLHRRVAVKVLRSGLMAHGGSAGVQRMLREARAMAKLSHPNVITVFEVDQMTSGRSFIAMEYVDGGTLRDWGRATHGWRAVLQVYAAAGAGLAAAHAQGLVHRDFKPDNVLIGKDGRVRVTDFGLVGALDGETTVSEPAILTASSSGSRTAALGPDEATLTRTGSLLGTPAYMAPEEGRQIDARSDQFSFCVALYEALYGERPFAGDSLMELRSNVCNGRRRPVPSDADVPRWLREVVERGLEVDPDARWAAMQDLLRALLRDPSRRHRKLAYGVAGLSVVGTAVAFVIGTDEPSTPACDRGEDKTAVVWNETRGGALREAFTGADPQNAAAGFGSLESAMDGFVAAWETGHLDACEAHRVRADQSGVMFDRRMLCLQRRLDRVDALLGAFEQPDAGTVAAASNIEGALPSVETCADAEALQSMVPPPDAPAVRTAWKRLQLGIDRADALGVAGKQLEALEGYAELREGIDAVDHPPLSARYLQNYANALIRVEKYTEAIDVLASAPEAAARSDDARIEANVWLLLARAHGFGLGDAKAGAWAARAAEIAAVRADDQAMMRLNIQFTQSILAESAGEYPQAVAAARRAVDSAEAIFGHAHRNTSAAWGTLGNALRRLGERDEARKAHETSLAIDRGLHETPHPDVAASLINLGLIDEDEGDFEAARIRYQEALQIYEQSVGEEHGAYGTVLLNLASNAANRADYDDARVRYQQVLEVYAKTVPEGHADYATVFTGLAEIALAEAHLDEALSKATKALEIRVAALGKDHPKVMLARTILGRVRLARGEHDGAEVELREAKRIAEETLAPDHLDHIDILVALGEVLLATQRAPEAKPLLERAVGLAEDAPAQKRIRAKAALRRAEG